MNKALESIIYSPSPTLERESGDKLLFALAQLPGEEIDSFFTLLHGDLTEEEITAFQICVAYIRMMREPQLGEAIKASVASALYEAFNQN